MSSKTGTYSENVLAKRTLGLLANEVQLARFRQKRMKAAGTESTKEFAEMVGMLARSVATFLAETRKAEKNTRDRGKRATPAERKAHVKAYLRSLKPEERAELLEEARAEAI